MSTPGNREVAHRILAAEFDDADLEYSQSDEERAPNYVVTPSGARVNRLFFVGVLTEKERVNDDVLRARVVDPTGAFVVYAGQYQPDELAFLEEAEPPAFVAVTGKARTFKPDDSDRTFTSVRPETITEVDAADRDRAAVTAAEHTVDRVAAMADALGREERGDDLEAALTADGTPPELAEGIALALDHYGTDLAYLDALRTLSLDVARVVAGDRDEAGDLPLAPDAEATEPVDRVALTGAPETLTAGESEEAVATDGPSASTDDTDAETEAEVEAEAATATAGGATTPDDGDAEPTTTTGSEVDTATTTGETTEPDPGATDDAGAAAGPDDAASADTAMGSEGIGDGDDDLGDFDGSLSTDADGDDGETPEESPADGDADADAEPAEPASADADATADEAAPTADTDEMYEFDEEERQEIEEEYGTEFSTGSEVESPDEDLAPDADAAAEEAAAEDAADASEVVADESDEASDDADADESAADADVDDVLLDAMQELDDGEGAERAALIDAVVDRTGADESAVEDAIQDALMGGQCYEPDDGRLKPI